MNVNIKSNIANISSVQNQPLTNNTLFVIIYNR